MKIRDMFFLASILNVLVFVPIHAAQVVDRGGYRGDGARDVNAEAYDRGVYGEGGYYGTPGVIAPGYGGYLLPGEVDPGQDDADAIYRANQHPGE
jgi:hypothetical protein